MTQLYFRYSTMNAGKSLEILKIANNYREQGKEVMIFTPAIDNRYGTGKVTSRIGISENAVIIDNDMDLYQTIYDEVYINRRQVKCVLVDESQFLSRDNVMELAETVDKLNLPVICYGLKNDFRNKLFEGSKWLLVYADKIEEIKTVCWFCDRKATMILKYNVHGNVVFTGEQIEIGGNDTYKSVCRRHYYSKGEEL